MRVDTIQMTGGPAALLDRATQAVREYREKNNDRPTHIAMHTMTHGALAFAAGVLDDYDPDAQPPAQVLGLLITSDDTVPPGRFVVHGWMD